MAAPPVEASVAPAAAAPVVQPLTGAALAAVQKEEAAYRARVKQNDNLSDVQVARRIEASKERVRDARTGGDEAVSPVPAAPVPAPVTPEPVAAPVAPVAPVAEAPVVPTSWQTVDGATVRNFASSADGTVVATYQQAHNDAQVTDTFVDGSRERVVERPNGTKLVRTTNAKGVTRSVEYDEDGTVVSRDRVEGKPAVAPDQPAPLAGAQATAWTETANNAALVDFVANPVADSTVAVSDRPDGGIEQRQWNADGSFTSTVTYRDGREVVTSIDETGKKARTVVEDGVVTDRSTGEVAPRVTPVTVTPEQLAATTTTVYVTGDGERAVQDLLVDTSKTDAKITVAGVDVRKTVAENGAGLTVKDDGDATTYRQVGPDGRTTVRTIDNDTGEVERKRTFQGAAPTPLTLPTYVTADPTPEVTLATTAAGQPTSTTTWSNGTVLTESSRASGDVVIDTSLPTGVETTQLRGVNGDVVTRQTTAGDAELFTRDSEGAGVAQALVPGLADLPVTAVEVGTTTEKFTGVEVTKGQGGAKTATFDWGGNAVTVDTDRNSTTTWNQSADESLRDTLNAEPVEGGDDDPKGVDWNQWTVSRTVDPNAELVRRAETRVGDDGESRADGLFEVQKDGGTESSWKARDDDGQQLTRMNVELDGSVRQVNELNPDYGPDLRTDYRKNADGTIRTDLTWDESDIGNGVSSFATLQRTDGEGYVRYGRQGQDEKKTRIVYTEVTDTFDDGRPTLTEEQRKLAHDQGFVIADAAAVGKGKGWQTGEDALIMLPEWTVMDLDDGLASPPAAGFAEGTGNGGPTAPGEGTDDSGNAAISTVARWAGSRIAEGFGDGGLASSTVGNAAGAGVALISGDTNALRSAGGAIADGIVTDVVADVLPTDFGPAATAGGNVVGALVSGRHIDVTNDIAAPVAQEVLTNAAGSAAGYAGAGAARLLGKAIFGGEVTGTDVIDEAVATGAGAACSAVGTPALGAACYGLGKLITGLIGGNKKPDDLAEEFSHSYDDNEALTRNPNARIVDDVRQGEQAHGALWTFQDDVNLAGGMTFNPDQVGTLDRQALLATTDPNTTTGAEAQRREDFAKLAETQARDTPELKPFANYLQASAEYEDRAAGRGDAWHQRNFDRAASRLGLDDEFGVDKVASGKMTAAEARMIVDESGPRLGYPVYNPLDGSRDPDSLRSFNAITTDRAAAAKAQADLAKAQAEGTAVVDDAGGPTEAVKQDPYVGSYWKDWERAQREVKDTGRTDAFATTSKDAIDDRSDEDVYQTYLRGSYTGPDGVEDDPAAAAATKRVDATGEVVGLIRDRGVKDQDVAKSLIGDGLAGLTSPAYLAPKKAPLLQPKGDPEFDVADGIANVFTSGVDALESLTAGAATSTTTPTTGDNPLDLLTPPGTTAAPLFGISPAVLDGLPGGSTTVPGGQLDVPVPGSPDGPQDRAGNDVPSGQAGTFGWTDPRTTADINAMRVDAVSPVSLTPLDPLPSTETTGVLLADSTVAPAQEAEPTIMNAAERVAPQTPILDRFPLSPEFQGEMMAPAPGQGGTDEKGTIPIDPESLRSDINPGTLVASATLPGDGVVSDSPVGILPVAGQPGVDNPSSAPDTFGWTDARTTADIDAMRGDAQAPVSLTRVDPGLAPVLNRGEGPIDPDSVRQTASGSGAVYPADRAITTTEGNLFGTTTPDVTAALDSLVAGGQERPDDSGGSSSVPVVAGLDASSVVSSVESPVSPTRTDPNSTGPGRTFGGGGGTAGVAPGSFGTAQLGDLSPAPDSGSLVPLRTTVPGEPSVVSGGRDAAPFGLTQLGDLSRSDSLGSENPGTRFTVDVPRDLTGGLVAEPDALSAPLAESMIASTGGGQPQRRRSSAGGAVSPPPPTSSPAGGGAGEGVGSGGGVPPIVIPPWPTAGGGGESTYRPSTPLDYQLLDELVNEAEPARAQAEAAGDAEGLREASQRIADIYGCIVDCNFVPSNTRLPERERELETSLNELGRDDVFNMDSTHYSYIEAMANRRPLLDAETRGATVLGPPVTWHTTSSVKLDREQAINYRLGWTNAALGVLAAMNGLISPFIMPRILENNRQDIIQQRASHRTEIADQLSLYDRLAQNPQLMETQNFDLNMLPDGTEIPFGDPGSGEPLSLEQSVQRMQASRPDADRLTEEQIREFTELAFRARGQEISPGSPAQQSPASTTGTQGALPDGTDGSRETVTDTTSPVSAGDVGGALGMIGMARLGSLGRANGPDRPLRREVIVGPPQPDDLDAATTQSAMDLYNAISDRVSIQDAGGVPSQEQLNEEARLRVQFLQFVPLPAGSNLIRPARPEVVEEFDAKLNQIQPDDVVRLNLNTAEARGLARDIARISNTRDQRGPGTVIGRRSADAVLPSQNQWPLEEGNLSSRLPTFAYYGGMQALLAAGLGTLGIVAPISRDLSKITTERQTVLQEQQVLDNAAADRGLAEFLQRWDTNGTQQSDEGAAAPDLPVSNDRLNPTTAPSAGNELTLPGNDPLGEQQSRSLSGSPSSPARTSSPGDVTQVSGGQRSRADARPPGVDNDPGSTTEGRPAAPSSSTPNRAPANTNGSNLPALPSEGGEYDRMGIPELVEHLGDPNNILRDAERNAALEDERRARERREPEVLPTGQASAPQIYTFPGAGAGESPETETFPGGPPVGLEDLGTVPPFPNGDPVTVRDSIFTAQTEPGILSASAADAPAGTSTPAAQPGSTRRGSDGQVQTLVGSQVLVGDGAAGTTPGQVSFFRSEDGRIEAVVQSPRRDNGDRTETVWIPNVGPTLATNPKGTVTSVQEASAARLTTGTSTQAVQIRTGTQTQPLAGTGPGSEPGSVTYQAVPENPRLQDVVVEPSATEVVNTDGSRTITYSALVPENRQLSSSGAAERFRVAVGTPMRQVQQTRFVPALAPTLPVTAGVASPALTGNPPVVDPGSTYVAPTPGPGGRGEPRTTQPSGGQGRNQAGQWVQDRVQEAGQAWNDSPVTIQRTGDGWQGFNPTGYTVRFGDGRVGNYDTDGNLVGGDGPGTVPKWQLESSPPAGLLPYLIPGRGGVGAPAGGRVMPSFRPGGPGGNV
ncbi:MAG: hypothetical protein LH603_16460 [Pseudonocardia sp.]|nr:hypothetical protein [Pseudonocardia sp.]